MSITQKYIEWIKDGVFGPEKQISVEDVKVISDIYLEEYAFPAPTGYITSSAFRGKRPVRDVEIQLNIDGIIEIVKTQEIVDTSYEGLDELSRAEASMLQALQSAGTPIKIRTKNVSARALKKLARAGRATYKSEESL